jgi:putative transposase
MSDMGLEAIHPKKRRQSFDKGTPESDKYPYLLSAYHNDKKQVVVHAPNEVWSADITYIPIKGGHMYLAAIIDWHSRAILSYKISNTMDTTLVTDVLKDAIDNHGIPKIMNSDQGSQYRSREHIRILEENGIQISMNGKGRSIDNIAIERFFRTLKYDEIYLNEYKDAKELKRGVARFIEFYNFKRFHSSLGYKKPMNVYLEGMRKEVGKVA